MSREHAFLSAILNDPDDESPRLVFADWLDERADPRGVFLRVQVELARWVPDLARRSALQARERELLARHGAEWIGPLGPICTPWRFEGGLARLTLPARRFVGRRFALAADEWLTRAWAAGLRLEQPVGRFQLAALAAAPHLAHIASLDLSGADLDDAAIRTLAASPHLGRLRRLDLGNNRLGDAGAAALSRAPWLDGLTELDLRNNEFTGVGAAELLTRLDPARLRRLDLYGNSLGREGLRRWLAWRDDRPATGPPPRVLNSLGMELARVPAGSFRMGSPDVERSRYDDEGPQREVTLTRPFYLSVYPVTQSAYAAVMGANPSLFQGDAGGGPHHPVDSVSWDDAAAFCRRLSTLPEERAAGRAYRLPTEAEWEHACRAGAETPFWWGASASARQANFDGHHPYDGGEEGPFLGRTSRVGAYAANPFGLYDLHGNVWEWCADWYAKEYYAAGPAVDPPGPAAGEWHVLRGGCWQHLGACSRAAYRLDHAPGAAYQGFRVALV
jgi:uncharacterized protein (TIGR02996 family)